MLCRLLQSLSLLKPKSFLPLPFSALHLSLLPPPHPLPRRPHQTQIQCSSFPLRKNSQQTTMAHSLISATREFHGRGLPSPCRRPLLLLFDLESPNVRHGRRQRRRNHPLQGHWSL